MKLGCVYFYTMQTNNSKWIKDLNVRPETIELLEENIGGKFFHISLGNSVLDLIPERKATKVEINKWD